MAVAFDATGAGNFTGGVVASPDAYTWSHTLAASANCIVVWIEWFAGTSGAISGVTRTVTVGGQTCTPNGVIETGGGTSDGQNVVEGYYLLNPPTGAQTVSVTLSQASTNFAGIGTSESYTGVGSVGTPVTNSGTGTSGSSGSVTSGTNHMVAQCFGANGAVTVSAYSGNQRVNNAGGGVGQIVTGDAAGASTVTITATLASSMPWGSVAMDLVPPADGVAPPLQIPNKFVGPMALRNRKVQPYVPILIGNDGVWAPPTVMPPLVIPNPYVGPQALRQQRTARIPYSPNVAARPNQVLFDTVGGGASGVNSGGSPVAGTSFTITATFGADVFFAIQFTNSGTGSPSNVQCNGSAMTLVDSVRAGGISNAGATFLYRAAGAGTGSAITLTYTVPAVAWYVANAVSYTGVYSVSAPVENNGNSSTYSSGPVAVQGTNQLALWAGGGGNSVQATVNSTSGGTNRVNSTANAGTVNLVISDNNAPTTFTASLSASDIWSSIAVVLSPTPDPPGPGALGPLIIPNQNVGPTALRYLKRLPYVPSRITGVQGPPAYDSQGTGFTGSVSGTTGSWTHAATQGSYVIVALSGFINVASNGGFSGVTFGGQPMTRLYDSYNNSVPANGCLTFYGIANAPGGPQTVQFTTVSTGAIVTANSFSYTGVGGVSPFQWPAYNNSSSQSQTITNNVTNGLVFQAFADNSLAFTGLTGGNIRFNRTSLPASSNVAGLAVQDTSATGSISFTASTSSAAVWCGMGLILSPTAWPTVSTAPFAGALTKFQNQQNVTIQVIGDSTSYGYLDSSSSPFLSGWVGRLAVILGNYYDYNVNLQQFNGTVYGAATALRTSPRGGAAPTLLIYDGGIVGALLINDLQYISQNNQITATSDVVFVGDAINEAINGYNSEEFVGLWGMELGYIVNVYCAGVPVIVTTENPLGNGPAGTNTNYAVDEPVMVSFLSALAQNLLGTTLAPNGVPLGGALMQGNYNVSMMDTRQAFLYQYQASIMADGAHPNSFGYQVQANWMAGVLAPWTVSQPAVPPVQIANPLVGPQALRNGHRLPYVSSQRQGFTDSANQTIAFGFTDAEFVQPVGVMPPLQIPNPSVGPMALRQQKHMPSVLSRSVSVSQNLSDGANSTWTFTTSTDGHRGITDGASQTIVFATTVREFVQPGGLMPPLQIANPLVGPMALRNRKRLPYVSSQRQGYTDSANQAIVFSTSTDGHRGITDSANSTWVFTTSVVEFVQPNGKMPPLVIPNPRVGPQALRQVKRMPYVGSQRQGYTDGANQAIVFTTSSDGFVDRSYFVPIIIPNPFVGPMALRHLKHMPYVPNATFGPRGLSDGANTTIVFTTATNGRRGITEGANSTWTFTTSTDGHRGIKDGANITVVWTTTDDGFVDHPGAKTAVIIPTPLVGPQALRHQKRMPYLPGRRASFSDSANQTITFSVPTNGVRAITDGANTTITFTNVTNGRRGIKDGANLTITVATTVAGRRAIRDGANLTLVLATAVDGTVRPFLIDVAGTVVVGPNEIRSVTVPASVFNVLVAPQNVAAGVVDLSNVVVVRPGDDPDIVNKP